MPVHFTIALSRKNKTKICKTLPARPFYFTSHHLPKHFTKKQNCFYMTFSFPKLTNKKLYRRIVPCCVLISSAFISLSCKAQEQSSQQAKSSIKVTVTDAPGFLIPTNFTGLSFEADAIAFNHRGAKGYFFSPSNKQLVNLFRNVGIRNLRMGGGTVDMHPEQGAYNQIAIDSLFAFAKVVGIKVIYSLPMLNASDSMDAVTAKYIWTHYKDDLECFSIGNEPNCPPYRDAKVGAIKSYEEYLPIWRKFAATIVKAVPGAKFTGPDAGGWNWTEEFARDEKPSGLITIITHHQYPGGKPEIMKDGKPAPMPTQVAIDNMLSAQWLTGEYKFIYEHTDPKVAPYGFLCRLTEANDYLGGIAGASNAMSSTLWALDYMHWQADRELCGINFHNNQWLKTCTIYLGQNGEVLANPKGYAIRAFDLIAGSRVEPLTMANPTNANVTAYASKGDGYLYVTLINKEHGANAHAANVSIAAGFTKGKASAMYLTAPNNDPGAMTGITLGGDAITNTDTPWKGKWTNTGEQKNGEYNIDVAPASAVVVRIPVPLASKLKSHR